MQLGPNASSPKYERIEVENLSSTYTTCASIALINTVMNSRRREEGNVYM